jgi:YidC/Oxa1 family membrane protein insertase
LIGTIWNTIIYRPILNALLLLYTVFGNNLGLAIIVLTIGIRVLLFPLMRSQLSSTSKLRRIQPKLQKLQKKYKDDPQKMQEAQLKLYREVGYNPLGCFLSILIPYPFLLAIYQAIRAFSSNEAVEGIYEFVSSWIGLNGDLKINQQFLFWDLSDAYLPLGKDHGYFEIWVLAYLLLAVLVGVSQYFSIKLSSKQQEQDDKEKKDKKGSKEKKKNKKKPKKDNEPNMENMAKDMGKSMMLTMPMMTTFIALSAPAAVSIYWIVQSWVLVGMRVAYSKFMKKEK